MISLLVHGNADHITISFRRQEVVLTLIIKILPPVTETARHRETHQETISPSSEQSNRLPFVEPLLLGVALEAAVLNDEPHPLVEGGRDGGWLLPQEDVDGGGHGVAQLGVFTGGRLAALGVLTVHQAIYIIIISDMLTIMTTIIYSPLSLSTLSSQFCSSLMSQPGPYQPLSHRHSHLCL